MILLKFEKTIQVNEDEWRNVFVEKVFEKEDTLDAILKWAKNEQGKPRPSAGDVALDVRGLIITEI